MLGPSLFDFLRKNNYRSFPVDLVREIGRQVLECVACIDFNPLLFLFSIVMSMSWQVLFPPFFWAYIFITFCLVNYLSRLLAEIATLFALCFNNFKPEVIILRNCVLFVLTSPVVLCCSHA